MPYTQEISRAHPALVMFVLDQSGSMMDPSAGDARRRKIDVLASSVNRFFRELTLECSKGEPKPRDYFHVALIGYCTDNTGAQALVGSAFQGALAGRDVVPVSELFGTQLRTEMEEDPVKRIKVRSYVWYDPVAQHGTPTLAALSHANAVAAGWIAEHYASFPPIVLHITDGEATDATPEQVEVAADKLKALSTDDGNLLLFNCHLSERDDPRLVFPAHEFDIEGPDSRLLFRMSSVLPEPCVQQAAASGYTLDANARGMMFNADASCLSHLIQIGTRVARQNVAVLR